MDTDIRPQAAAPATESRAAGVALMLGSALSNQTGAAVGALAFG
jgi:inner membrane transporter RhtA